MVGLILEKRNANIMTSDINGMETLFMTFNPSAKPQMCNIINRNSFKQFKIKVCQKNTLVTFIFKLTGAKTSKFGFSIWKSAT